MYVTVEYSSYSSIVFIIIMILGKGNVFTYTQSDRGGILNYMDMLLLFGFLIFLINHKKNPVLSVLFQKNISNSLSFKMLLCRGS